MQEAKGLPFEPLQRPGNLFEALLNARRRHGGAKEILEDHDRAPLTYDRLVTAAYAVAAKLRKFAAARETVGVLLPSSVGAAVTFFAVQAAGCTPAMLNFSAGRKAVGAACALAGVKLVLTSERFIREARLDQLAKDLEGAGAVVKLETVRRSISWPEKAWAALAAHLPFRFHAEMQPDDPAVILFTSGTTGAPKGVVLSHANLLTNVEQCRLHVEFGRDWIFFNTLPIFHAFGLTGGTLLPLLLGRKAVLYPTPLHHEQIPKLVRATRATILISTDTFASHYARAADAADMSTLKHAVLGAERVREETREVYARKFGAVVLEGYGATECSPVVSVNQPQANRPGTVGTLLPGVEVRLDPVPGLTEGALLHVRGPNVMKGYLSPDRPGAIEPPRDGWFDTGDLATLDADGYLTITGRLKRFARIGAEMVSLTAVEGHAEKLWPDARHAAISIAGARGREQIILLTEQRDAELDAFRAWRDQHGAAPIETPRRIIVVPEIPILATGKVDYGTVQRMAEERLETSGDSDASNGSDQEPAAHT